MEPTGTLCTKEPISVLMVPTSHFEQKCTDVVVELDDNLQKVERCYSLVQNPTVVSNTPQL